ncbi:class I SAM-dependent methyltransferase [Rhodanobacter ginsengisoli]|uniref:Class I SAM-dependent methyltransferase n=1 Tax=Rhodanobacter ginsengisoli TaxID=418646 RepID=A0ABW0QS49_9GAMM
MKEINETPYVGLNDAAPLTKWLASARTNRVVPFLKGDMLELGCGAATILDSSEVRKAISSYTGVEALESSISELRTRYPDHSFYSFDLDTITWPLEEKYDCVLALAVIEHLWNLKAIFLNLRRILIDDGLVIITTPTPYGNHVILRALAFIGLVRKDVIDDHVTIFNKKLFMHACIEFGFKIERYQKFQFGGNQLVVLRKLPHPDEQ